MEKDSDMFNMNLATELNRNLYLDVVKVNFKRWIVTTLLFYAALKSP